MGRPVEDTNRPLKVEFAYLKQLPREYSGPRHRVKVGQRPDGLDECEERPGEPPPNQSNQSDQLRRRSFGDCGRTRPGGQCAISEFQAAKKAKKRSRP